MKDKDIKTWVSALRSGEYRQGQHRLCITECGEEYHCCLGVMIEELIDDDWERCNVEDVDPDIPEDIWSIDNCAGTPSDLTLQKIGLSSDQANNLIDLNDIKGYSFEEIADWIEDHREELINEG